MSRENPLSRFFEWVGNPLELTYADRSLLIFALIAPPLVIGHYGLASELASRALGGDPVGVYTRYVAIVMGWIVRAWVLALLITIALRRLAPNSLVPAYLVCILYALNASALCYAWGPTTSAFSGFIMVGGLVGGRLLYGWAPTLSSAVTFLTLTVCTEVAVQHGVIPYAPVFQVLIEGGRNLPVPSSFWLVRAWGAAILVTTIIAGLFGYTVHQMERRERDLNEAQGQLSHAMDMIRRYVPAQLADQILDGRYSEKERYVRRTLTLFFSDIRGFTETADQLESEKLSELLNEYLTEMSDIAESFGGTIDKFVGDAVVIFFGAPEPMEEKEQALRAVRMALAMQARMGELSKKWYESGIQTPFEIRVGINTGAATVGDFGSEGRMDYTAIGTQVNLAARLESQCTPGKVLISHATWGLVHDEIACTPRGDIQVKGIHYPVKVYEIEADATASSEDTR